MDWPLILILAGMAVLVACGVFIMYDGYKSDHHLTYK